MRSVSMVLSGRQCLAHLFENHTQMRTMIDAVLQGYCGTVEADADAQVAQISLRPFTVLGGDPSHPAAREIVEYLPPWSMVVAEDGWRDLLMQIRGGAIITSQRMSFSSADLDLAHLRGLTSRVPQGFEIERIDEGLAARVSDEVSPDLIMPEVFASPEDFAQRGIGFCAVSDGRIACAATSAIVCNGAVEIQINTNAEYRRMGLATAVGAALAAYCLEHGIVPHWEAENPHSMDLAKKLGYTADGSYDVFTVTAEESGRQHISHLFADESAMAAG